MDKYDYITATVEDEKVRLEKLIAYLKETSSDELPEYQERYNNILKYLTAKEKYYDIENSIKEDKDKLYDLNKTKDEYEVDNILLEDTLLSKFHEDTGNIYRNLLYENIKYEDESVRDILYLLFSIGTKIIVMLYLYYLNFYFLKQLSGSYLICKNNNNNNLFWLI